MVSLEEIQVLDHGFVRLDGLMLDVRDVAKLAAGEKILEEVLNMDKSVVNSAKVSFAARVDEIGPKEEGLINFLMKNKHGTPFEHNGFRFHVKAPIFVVREWQRHRISSYNEFSTRYSKITEPHFYVPSPENWRQAVEGSKPGEYTYEPWKGNTKQAMAALTRHYQDAVDLYNWMLDAGIARELARLPLPVGMYTEMYWTVNARSLMNFLNLRGDDGEEIDGQAQWEIREYARIIAELMQDTMPATYNTFLTNGRERP